MRMSLIMCIFARFYLLITNLKKIKVMTTERAKELLPMIIAYSEGKTIQYFDKDGCWKDIIDPKFFADGEYRIKPDKEYRPFSSIAECWEEMKKHEPFAWLKDKEGGDYIVISNLEDDNITIGRHDGWDLAGLLREFTFADGEPFGIERL